VNVKLVEIWCLKGLFGSGNIPKWLRVATEKVVARCLIWWMIGDMNNQISGIFHQNGGLAHLTKFVG
jgi:hypothetical protein